ncbi:ATP-grasp domain-containing protein [Paenibacillus lutrae]|uniref:ATP-grasp domain-containing protein n=1 Tax=Paenibacillus lutrae TaxID=2078573 RepID=A0A7X3FK72_9BACL|nr:ATP-grasp domain-containing protein [Paenibacillus lutrae]MVP01155.1 ATP-grasp domain-containing protein [Paenibacillus lutrae]
MRVLITGARSYTALDMARRLQLGGCSVYAADCVRYPVSAGSRALTRCFYLSSPREDLQGFIRGLQAVIRRERIQLLLPSSEEILYLAPFLEELEADCRVFCAPFEQLKMLHNKWTFSQLTEECLIQTPETVLMRTPEDMAGLRLPAGSYVFKPVYSRFASRTVIAPERFPAGVKPSEEDPWIAQKYVRGRELCSYHLAVDGVIAAQSCYEPVYRLGKASGYYFEPVQHPRISSFAAELVRKLNFTGHISFDFIEEESGHLFVLECNPRSTSGLHLVSRRDFVKPVLEFGLARASIDGIEPLTDARLEEKTGGSATSAKPRMIAYAMLGNPFYHGLRGVKRWLRDYGRAEDVLWDRADPWVIPYHVLSLAETVYDSLTRRISFKDAATANIEWDGEPEWNR